MVGRVGPRGPLEEFLEACLPRLCLPSLTEQKVLVGWGYEVGLVVFHLGRLCHCCCGKTQEQGLKKKTQDWRIGVGLCHTKYLTPHAGGLLSGEPLSSHWLLCLQLCPLCLAKRKPWSQAQHHQSAISLPGRRNLLDHSLCWSPCTWSSGSFWAKGASGHL